MCADQLVKAIRITTLVDFQTAFESRSDVIMSFKYSDIIYILGEI